MRTWTVAISPHTKSAVIIDDADRAERLRQRGWEIVEAVERPEPRDPIMKALAGTGNWYYNDRLANYEEESLGVRVGRLEDLYARLVRRS